MNIHVVMTGRAYHRAEPLPAKIELPEGATIAGAVAKIRELLLDRENGAGENGAEVLSPACMIAVGGRHVGSVAQFDDAPLADGDELVLIAPVAGG